MLPIELLAPAKNIDVARQAILHGADAVYIGGPGHGARAAASNSIADIAALVEFAHGFGVRVYVTLNTIIYDDELADVRSIVTALYRAGVDALIVQDMALLDMELPPVALHASTQCDTRTPAKARFLADCGFSQIVLARELSAKEIAEIRRVVPEDIPLEGFVHGALCVSFSGDCQASCVALGRSANRGECAQMCRMSYDLVDATGRVLVRDRHLLSLRDLSLLGRLPQLLDAGVQSLKIEGRLKDERYVKNVVAAYRAELDKVIARSNGRYVRASYGRSDVKFNPDPAKSFNRGASSYFFDGKPSGQLANFITPKSMGVEVGRVVACRGKVIKARLTEKLNNGDGLCYVTPAGEFHGFRVNRIEGSDIFVSAPMNLPAGTVLTRNRDMAFEAALEGDTAVRTVAVSMTLRRVGTDRAALAVSSESGCRVEVCAPVTFDSARSDQKAARLRTLSKLGDTIFRLDTLDDRIGPDVFIPASDLTALRRSAIERLASAARMTYRYAYRRPVSEGLALENTDLTYHDNVANSVASGFYRRAGARNIAPALETLRPDLRREPGRTVMTTRYCLRRELGACLRTPGAKKYPAELFLRTDAATYRLRFDCSACNMHVETT